MPPKTKDKTKTPSTVLDKIITAIRALRNGPKGSSRAAITKYLKSEFDYANATALKAALKRGVSKGTLVQSGQSFRVAGDPVEQDGNEETVQIKDVGKPPSKSDDLGGQSCSRGDVVVVSYVGTLEDGYEFDRSSGFEFQLGAGDVIKGWDIGVDGMKVGGKRQLIVPSKHGYGKRGCKPDIPPNATLFFDITLKKIKDA